MENLFGNLLSRGDRVAVALSGGKDSVALFHALCMAEKQLGIEVLAINVEHGIRGDASIKDSEFVKKLCDNAGKRLLFYKIDAPAYARENKMGTEAAARALRYKCFFTALNDGLCDKIATAHHLNDNTESVLLNVFRGSGLNGLKGISESSYQNKIIRPFLKISREQIDEYALKHNLQYVTDQTNFDSAYTRNFLRNEVLPLVREKFPEVDTAILRLGEIASETEEYLNNKASAMLYSCGDERRVKIPQNYLEELPVLTRAIIKALKEVGLEKDYEQIHVNSVLALIENGAGATVNLPHGVSVDCGYGELIFYKETPIEPFEFAFKEGEFDLPNGRLTIEKVCLHEMNIKEKVPFFTQKQREGTLFVEDLPILAGAVIRTRKEGDVIKKFGGGTKPLKEFLIDKKIERRTRLSLPVCAVGSEVLFVAGVEISSSVAVKGKNTYKITYQKCTKEK